MLSRLYRSRLFFSSNARPILAILLIACSGSAAAGELGDLLRDVLDHPDIAAQRSLADAAGNQLDAASASYYGSGSASAENTTYESDRFLGVLNPSGFASPSFARNQFRYGVSYTLPVDLFGVIAANRESAERNLAAAALVLHQETLLKLHQALSAYVRLQALRAQTTALELQRQRVAATVQRVAAEVGSGELGSTDLKLAQSELARVDAERVGLEGQREQALAALEEAAGRRQSPTASTIAVPKWSLGTEHETLPERIAQAGEEATAAQARAARRALWPSLSANADYYQYQGDGHDQSTWSAGARLSVPLDVAAVQKTAGAEARVEAAHEAAAAAKRKARSQLAALRAAYDAAVADVRALVTELDYREQVVAVQEELAKVGAQTLEDSLRHERDRVETEARLAQARTQAVEAWSAAQVLCGVEAGIYIREAETP
jgi:outer membrane protein TolC